MVEADPIAVIDPADVLVAVEVIGSLRIDSGMRVVILGFHPGKRSAGWVERNFNTAKRLGWNGGENESGIDRCAGSYFTFNTEAGMPAGFDDGLVCREASVEVEGNIDSAIPLIDGPDGQEVVLDESRRVGEFGGFVDV